MAIVRKSPDAPKSPPARPRTSADRQPAAQSQAEPATEDAAAPAEGEQDVIRSARRAPPPRQAPQPSTDDLSWAASGEAAEAKVQEELARQEQAKLERRAEGYWPIRLYVPNKPGQNQADIVILDAQPGPSYFEHMMRNPRTGFWDQPEPCPKEFDTCPLCPPQGERDSVYTMLLTVLDMRGYRKADSTFVPLAKNLWGVRLSDHPFIHNLYKEHGSLRGIQILLTRSGDRGANYGDPEFVGKHTDEAIEDLIKRNGLWRPKVTREGETIDDEAWMSRPFVYGDFLKRPSGEKLRQKYGGAAPFGSASYARGSGGGIQPRGGGGNFGGRGGFGRGGNQLPNYDEAAEWGGGQYDPGQGGIQPRGGSEPPAWEPGADNVDENLGWQDNQQGGPEADAV